MNRPQRLQFHGKHQILGLQENGCLQCYEFDENKNEIYNQSLSNSIAHQGTIRCFVTSQETNTIALGEVNGSIQLLNLKTDCDNVLFYHPKHSRVCHCLSLTREWLLCGHDKIRQESSLTCHDLASGQLLASFGASEATLSCAIHPQSSFILGAGMAYKWCRIYDTRQSNGTAQVIASKQVNGFQWRNSFQWTVFDERTCKVYDMRKGNEILFEYKTENDILSLQSSEQGVALLTRKNTIIVPWEAPWKEKTIHREGMVGCLWPAWRQFWQWSGQSPPPEKISVSSSILYKNPMDSQHEQFKTNSKVYALDCEKNISFLTQQKAPSELIRTWQWLNSLNNDLDHPWSAITLRQGFVPLVQGSITRPFLQLVTYHHEWRQWTLKHCQCFMQPLEKALIELNFNEMCKILNESSASLLSTALQGYAQCTDVSQQRLWQKTIQTGISFLHPEKDVLFISFCRLLLGDPISNLLQQTLPWQKIAFSCLFLSDPELKEYFEKQSQQVLNDAVTRILLDGIMWVGYERGELLMQEYLDQTGDLQSVALLQCLLSPEPYHPWLECYRDLLDQSQLFHTRTLLDKSIGKQTKITSPSLIALCCTYCQQKIQFTANSPPHSCPHCKKPLSRCSHCLLRLNGQSMVIWCLSCRHGGHAHHPWLERCPVPDCECFCK